MRAVHVVEGRHARNRPLTSMETGTSVPLAATSHTGRVPLTKTPLRATHAAVISKDSAAGMLMHVSQLHMGQCR